MTKLRAPESIEDAVHQAIALEGEDSISAAAGVSISLVRKWADPDDQAHRIGLHQALSIDERLIKGGHNPVFGALFDAQEQRSPAPEDSNPMIAAVRMTVDAAAVMDRVERCMADGVLDSQELISIRAAISRLQTRIGKLLRSLYFKAKKKGGK